jgi:streptomycin 6-kinase
MPLQALKESAPTDFAAATSPEGQAWLAALPRLLDDLARRWNFTITDGLVRHGYNAVVVPVSQDRRVLALKLTWPPDQARGEAEALAAWRARGAVELVNADLPRGALLLERLDASRSLASMPLAQAAAIAGALIRTLAIEAPRSFPSVQATACQLAASFQARQQALHDPLPGEWIALATGLAAELGRDRERSLLHTDLHYGNILASERPRERWVAIDPKAAAGTPARSAAELLWTRVDELPGPQAITGLLDTIVENGQLNHAKATAWAFVRSIDYWLWGLENGLTTDPVRCKRVASALAPIAGQSKPIPGPGLGPTKPTPGLASRNVVRPRAAGAPR